MEIVDFISASISHLLFAIIIVDFIYKFRPQRPERTNVLTLPIPFEDFDGVQKTETHEFMLTKAELMELKFSVAGGIDKMLEQIVATEDTTRIVETFKLIVNKAYGVRSEDGRRFMKTPELLEEFTQSACYHQLLFNLMTDAEFAASFTQQILPKDLAEAAMAQAQQDVQLPERDATTEIGREGDTIVVKDPEPPMREYTQAELAKMSNQDMLKAMGQIRAGRATIRI